MESLRERFDHLTTDQQDLVTNSGKLEHAGQTITSLEKNTASEKTAAENARKEEAAQKAREAARYKNSRPHANVTYRVTLKKKQKTKALKVMGLAGEDKVNTWKTSDQQKVVVRGHADGTCLITAGKKTGNVTITASCASGKKVAFQLRIRKNKVTTKAIRIASRKVKLSVGKTLQLKPELYPITSVEKIKYSSKNKKVVKVSKSGRITARAKGSAVIEIKSGKKKLKVKVTVK